MLYFLCDSEFFQVVQQYLFDPRTISLLPDDAIGGISRSAACSIGSQWLQMAREKTKSTSNKNAITGDSTPIATTSSLKSTAASWFPLFDFSDEHCTHLCISPRPFLLDYPPILIAGSLYHVPFQHLAHEPEELLKLYKCVGRLIGLALRHKVVLGAHFPLAFWQLIQGEDSTWEAFCGSDTVLRSSLQAVLDHDFSTVAMIQCPKMIQITVMHE